MVQINSRIIGFSILVILVSISNIVDAAPNQVVLKSVYNSQYICAENAGASPLVANRANAFNWELFEMINNNDSTVSLRSRENNKFVCAENAAQGNLIANRDAIGPWEKFYLIRDSTNNTFALRSFQNNKYVSVTNNGQLIANSGTVGNRESFIISRNWKTLKSKSNGKYISAEDAGASPLVANRDIGIEWESFEMIFNDDKTWSFRAGTNNKFVCAESAGNSYLIANRDAIGPWEKFNLVGATNGVGIQSLANNKFVTVDGNKQLISNSVSLGDQQTFTISSMEVKSALSMIHNYFTASQIIFE